MLEEWFKLFESYIVAIGGERFTPYRKQHILLHNLGIQGRKIYETLPDPPGQVEGGEGIDSFTSTVQKLEAHFGDKVNVGLERHTFFTRVQWKQESVQNSIAALWGLTQLCEFGEITDSLIRDQLVRYTNNSRIQEKLLAKNPSLREAIDIAKSVQHTAKCIKEMKPGNEEVATVKEEKDEREREREGVRFAKL